MTDLIFLNFQQSKLGIATGLELRKELKTGEANGQIFDKSRKILKILNSRLFPILVQTFPRLFFNFPDTEYRQFPAFFSNCRASA